MRRIFIATIVLLSSIHSAMAQHACDVHQKKSLNPARELTDDRLKDLVTRVATLAGYGGAKTPLMCVGYMWWYGPSAAIVPLQEPLNGKYYVLLLPREMEEYSDEEDIGIIAHEFGHLIVGGLGRFLLSEEAVIEREQEVDLKAVAIVGKRAVLATLWVARDKMVPVLNPMQRESSLRGLKKRIEVIQALPD